MGSLSDYNLVDSNSPSLHLSQPTPDEQLRLWTTTAGTWGDSDQVPLWLGRFRYLTTIPLAKDGGMTMWILTDAEYPPCGRPILSSCDTILKRSVTCDGQGNTQDNIIHGIASVFTPPEYRRRGYAARLMKELATKLHGWQSEHTPCIGSILYSDIGETYYTNLGWHVDTADSQYNFKPAQVPWPAGAKGIRKPWLTELCERDEAIIRKSMKVVTDEPKRQMTIIPDVAHMLWHIAKEEFMSGLFLGKIPLMIGAIAGPPGSQIWAVWTHCYYSHPDEELRENGLYILRLVVENEEAAAAKINELVDSLKAVLEAAQHQASEWRLDYINLWEPSRLVRELIEKSGIEHTITGRRKEAIASGMWYDENGSTIDPPLWMNNERYAYC
jgi:GNAT superfamily N-acetyltransferase